VPGVLMAAPIPAATWLALRRAEFLAVTIVVWSA
jgi:hypothetical protein